MSAARAEPLRAEVVRRRRRQLAGVHAACPGGWPARHRAEPCIGQAARAGSVPPPVDLRRSLTPGRSWPRLAPLPRGLGGELAYAPPDLSQLPGALTVVSGRLADVVARLSRL